MGRPFLLIKSFSVALRGANSSTYFLHRQTHKHFHTLCLTIAREVLKMKKKKPETRLCPLTKLKAFFFQGECDLRANQHHGPCTLSKKIEITGY